MAILGRRERSETLWEQAHSLSTCIAFVLWTNERVRESGATRSRVLEICMRAEQRVKEDENMKRWQRLGAGLYTQIPRNNTVEQTTCSAKGRH